MFSKKMNKKEVDLLEKNNFKKTVYSSLFNLGASSNGRDTGWEIGDVKVIKVSKDNFQVENTHFSDLEEAIEFALQLKYERTFVIFPEVRMIGVTGLNPVSWGPGQQGGARVVLDFVLRDMLGGKEMVVRQNFDFYCNNNDWPKGCFDKFLEDNLDRS